MKKYGILFLLPIFLFSIFACSSGIIINHRFAILTIIHVQPGAERSEQLKAIVKEINPGDADGHNNMICKQCGF